MVSIGIDFLKVAKAKIKPRANCRAAHIYIRYSTPFAVRSTDSRTDCGEKQIKKLTRISSKANRPDTIRIHRESDFSCSDMIYALKLIITVGRSFCNFVITLFNDIHPIFVVVIVIFWDDNGSALVYGENIWFERYTMFMRKLDVHKCFLEG